MLSWQAAGLTEGFFRTTLYSSQPVSQGVTLLFFFTEKKKRSKKRKEFAFHLYYKVKYHTKIIQRIFHLCKIFCIYVETPPPPNGGPPRTERSPLPCGHLPTPWGVTPFRGGLLSKHLQSLKSKETATLFRKPASHNCSGIPLSGVSAHACSAASSDAYPYALTVSAMVMHARFFPA